DPDAHAALLLGIIGVEEDDLVGLAAVDGRRVVHQARDEGLVLGAVLRRLGLVDHALFFLLLAFLRPRLAAGRLLSVAAAADHDRDDDEGDDAQADADHQAVVGLRGRRARPGLGPTAGLDARIGGRGRVGSAADAGAAAALDLRLLLRLPLPIEAGDRRVAFLGQDRLTLAGDLGKLGVGDDVLELGVVRHRDRDGVGALRAPGFLASEPGGNLDDVPAPETPGGDDVGHTLPVFP